MPRIKNVIVFLMILAASLVLIVGVLGVAIGESSTMTMYPAVLELPIGGRLILQVQSTSGRVENRDLHWVSSNSSVAVVSQGGHVTALSVGETRIEAYVESDPSQKAFCRVLVTESGPVLLYPKDDPPEPPGEPPGETPDEPPTDSPGEGDGDEGIPVEHDPELDIPVEHDPRIDEYIWTIRIHDTISHAVPDAEVPVKLVYTLDLDAEKVGGKTSRGLYEGTATLEMKVDTSEMVDNIMKQAGGIFLKFVVDIGGTFQGDVSIMVADYDVDRYIHFNLKPGMAPIVPLVRLHGMALGHMRLFGTTTAGGSSTDVGGVSINLYQPPIHSDAPLAYKLTLLGSGKVEMSLDLGLNRSFKGQISRKPFVPN